jgi:membrane associated rhomboid family serine protease
VLRAAPATLAIAGVTIVVSLAVSLLGLENHAALYAGFMPARAKLGLAGDVHGLVPNLLTPLTATLIHGGPLHLAMNMLLLGYTGVAAERALGARGIVVLYLVGAYAAALGQWLPDPGSATPMIGASGAISAIVGAYALLYGRSRARAIGPIPAAVVNIAWLAAGWAAINILVAWVAQSAGLGIAAGAHVGGFLAGLALMRPLLAWNWRSA